VNVRPLDLQQGDFRAHFYLRRLGVCTLKRFEFIRLVLCLGMVFCFREASAVDVPLISDAHVNSAHPSINYGALSNLYVGNGHTSFLQFDLSTLPASTISAQVTRATLTVFVNRVNTAGSVAVSPVTASWGEYSVTSATAPATGGAIGSFPVSVAGQFISVDVTTQVQAWLNTPGIANGLALTSGTANAVFDSKENDETAHPARLDVTLVNQGPQGIQGIPGSPGPQGWSTGHTRQRWPSRCKWCNRRNRSTRGSSQLPRCMVERNDLRYWRRGLLQQF
jgi:hypothetical protein